MLPFLRAFFDRQSVWLLRDFYPHSLYLKFYLAHSLYLKFYLTSPRIDSFKILKTKILKLNLSIILAVNTIIQKQQKVGII